MYFAYIEYYVKFFFTLHISSMFWYLFCFQIIDTYKQEVPDEHPGNFLFTRPFYGEVQVGGRFYLPGVVFCSFTVII